jgi:class 3 adenylate cyclase
VDVAAWLHDLGLERYAQAFRDHDIDPEILPKLTGDDLSAIGVASLGHRRKLLEAIAALTAAAAPTAALAASETEHARSRKSEAERRQLTVLFCDLVGSTALAAVLDPEDLREVIGAYHRCVAETVARFDGFVAKYMGDGVLIYFGYPQAHEDDAERAVRAGLALAGTIGQLQAPTREALAARVGIATGLVVVGDLVGEGAAQEQAVVGETPNLAARLQAIAAPGQVVIADATGGYSGPASSSRTWVSAGSKASASQSRRLRSLAGGRSKAGSKQGAARRSYAWSGAIKSWPCSWSAGGRPRPARARACCWWVKRGSANRGSVGPYWMRSLRRRTFAFATSARPITPTARFGR